ncbi:antibiotic biosynthesis monooxygenase [Bacteroidota bacterium]
MIVTFVHVWVKEKFKNDFIKATIDNHTKSIKEPGNLRFDILQDEKDPLKFILYEAYETEEFAANHKSTDHYLKWRETVADWMAQPREGIKHQIICPTEKSRW